MFINQKGLAHIVVVIILLIGLIVGLALIKNPKIFQPKASEPSPEADSNTPPKTYMQLVHPARYGDQPILNFFSEDPDGISVIHTAVWEGNYKTGTSSFDEIKAKSSIPDEKAYQGYADKIGARFLNRYPALVEFYAMDKKGKPEDLHKILINSAEYSGTITVEISVGGNTSLEEVTLRKLIVDNQFYPYQSTNNNSYLFQNMDKTGHELTFFEPKNTRVSIEVCNTNSTCRLFNSPTLVENTDLGRLLKVPVSLNDSDGIGGLTLKHSEATVKLNYSSTQPLTPSPILTPSPAQTTTVREANARCDGNIVVFEFRKNPSVFIYRLRVDNLEMSPGWNGSCERPAAGDFCREYYADTGTPNGDKSELHFRNLEFSAGYDHQWWYEEVYKNGNISASSPIRKFKCP